MTRPKLKAEKREIFGRKVKKLRQGGTLPANLFGKKIKSVSLQVGLKDFEKVFEETGETGIVDLLIEKEKETRPVLIAEVQVHPVTDLPLHVDFRQVVLTEKVEATIPIELVGEAPAETQKQGILIQVLSEVEVKALPTDLPEHFLVDVTKLAEVDQVVLVKDIEVEKAKVQIMVEENQIVAKIEPLAKEEEVAPPPAEKGVSEEEAGPEGEAEKEAGAEEEEKKAPPAEEKSGEEENQTEASKKPAPAS